MKPTEYVLEELNERIWSLTEQQKRFDQHILEYSSGQHSAALLRTGRSKAEIIAHCRAIQIANDTELDWLRGVRKELCRLLDRIGD